MKFQDHLLSVEAFLIDFNRMCKETGKNKFIVEGRASLESSTPMTYKTEYFAQLNDSSILIFGKKKFLFFKWSTLPLVTICQSEEDLILRGLHVGGFQTFPPAKLKETLSEYLKYCRNLDTKSFIHI